MWSLRHGSWAGGVHRLHNDGRAPAIWTGEMSLAGGGGSALNALTS